MEQKKKQTLGTRAILSNGAGQKSDTVDNNNTYKWGMNQTGVASIAKLKLDDW